jgi:4-hydroxy-2-oxoheptanedioate aldolase
VAATRYPPEGVRGMAGMSRASRFGTVPNFFKQANQDLCVVLQLETVESITQLEAIAAVPGWMRCSSGRVTCPARWATWAS